jgi:hypothetical protein
MVKRLRPDETVYVARGIVKVQQQPEDPGQVLAQFSAGVPKDIPGNDQAVDLSRSLIDVADLGVSEPLFQQEIAAVAQRSKDLDRTLGDPCDDIAGADF